MSVRPLVAVTFCLALAACPGSTAPAADESFELPLGQPTTVAGTPFILTFDSVLEDSRCPVGAMCVWAGRARIRLSVTYQTGPDVLIQATLTTPHGSVPDSSTVIIGGYFVEFRDLLPAPYVIGPSRPDYRAVVAVRAALD